VTSKPFRWAILLRLSAGIFAVSTIVLSPISAGAQTSKSTRVTFSYDCCTELLVNAVHHPGDALALKWIQTTNPPNNYAATTITLSASVSGPFSSVASLKSAFARSHPKYGVINSKAIVIRLSDQKSAHPVSMIQIPADASKGFYELTTTVKEGSTAISGGAVIRVAP